MAGSIRGVVGPGLAAQAGLIPEALANQNANAYRALRHAQRGLRLNQQTSRVLDDSLDHWREPVQALWREVFGE